MIGVIANSSDYDVVREFFELFKTPWEFYRSDGTYDVVLCTKDERFRGNAKLVLAYRGVKTTPDTEAAIRGDRSHLQSRILAYRGHRIPIYGHSVTFPGKESWLIKDENSQDPAAYLEEREGAAQIRVGYDLFGEVRGLLTTGQPAANAGIPTLDLHIALLRDFIVGRGIPLVEIPPIPEGYRFIACLTHDVDHPSMRKHKWDHTVFGFLYRAVFVSWARLFSGKISLREFITNLLAASKLPFVYLGVAKDYWADFDERYLQLENGLPSTFFLIPFKNHSGLRCDARAEKLRAARYGAAELAEQVKRLTGASCEVGLHGIDAWCDSTRGRAELEEIRDLTGESELGVRMHWLYYDQESPTTLEMAGAAYDSTVGYNETVGYRAGTTQVYKPLNANHLLELPLHVMDTALFYPAYLGLSPEEARRVLDRIVDHATEFGGCITINWHDRSLAPERLWGTPYRELIQNLKNRGAWFATAGQAVSWFQKRRFAMFETNCTNAGDVSAKVTTNSPDNLPGLQLRIHGASDLYNTVNASSQAFSHIACQNTAEMPVS
jgi:peptidoglycan/xylan/chitin deacetylase (PgdA/CDA1 family)